MGWKEEAADIIAAATRDLPADTPLQERKRIIKDACPSWWRMMSWPQKAWQAARRDYLIRYGYKPRTKKQAERDAAVIEDLPMFARAAQRGE